MDLRSILDGYRKELAGVFAVACTGGHPDLEPKRKAESSQPRVFSAAEAFCTTDIAVSSLEAS